MIKKLTLGTLVGGIAGTIASSVWFMGLFGAQAEKWMAENAACVKQMDDMPYWAWVLAVLLMGFLGALTLHKLNINQVKAGAITGGILFCLVFSIAILFTYITLKSYQLSWVPVDIIGNTLGGIAGGAATGWLFGKLKH